MIAVLMAAIALMIFGMVGATYAVALLLTLLEQE